MDKYIFTGTLYPERAWANLPELTMSTITARDGTLLGNGKLTINWSQITFILERENTSLDIFTLKNSITHLIESYTGFFDFIMGYYHIVDIKQCVSSDGDVITFGCGYPPLENRFDITQIQFGDIVNLIQDERQVFIQSCIRDLSRAIQHPADTALFCFRAIESLRQYFSEGTSSKEKDSAWKALRAATNTQKSDFDFLTKHSTASRHGNNADFSEQERTQLLNFSYLITEKFISHLLIQKGNTPLTRKNTTIQSNP